MYTVVGHVRYDYGRGWWDEMWCENQRGQGAWISIDEGDVVLQHPVPDEHYPPMTTAPALGADISLRNTTYRVSERNTATCVAMRGEFPEIIEVGDVHDFVNASGPRGMLASGEFWPGGRAWYEGEWLDPFELDVVRMT